MFKNLAIKFKLQALLAMMLVAMLIIGLVGRAGISAVGAGLEEVGAVRLPSIDGLLTLSEAQTAVKAASLSTLMAQHSADAAKEFAAITQARRHAWDNATQGWKKYEPLPQTPEEAVMWKQFVGEWEAWKSADVQVAAAIDALAKGASDEEKAALLAKFVSEYQRSLPLFGKAEASLLKIVALNQKIADASVAEGQAATRQAVRLMLFAAIVAALVSFTFAMYVTSTITGPIRQAVELAKTVASGNLTSRIDVDSRDETGQLLSALKDMTANLVQIVEGVRSGTDTIATASGQIAAGNLDLSSRTEEQASSLEETAASMEELAATVKQNASNAQQANTLAQAASDVAVQGGAVVAQVIDTMGAINDSSRKITEIIGVIDGIAFQTNILALNAAVEAARAGEQGRGFAVVASEVRNLAQRSAAAAKEIKILIDNSVAQVDAGGRLVDKAGVTMNDVVASVARVTGVMSEIMAATHEQSLGIDQINRAVAQMDEVTQQNAALVEEAAAASGALEAQAQDLTKLVSTFKIA